VEGLMAGCLLSGRCDWEDFVRIGREQRKAVLLEQQQQSLARLTVNKKVDNPYEQIKREIKVLQSVHIDRPGPPPLRGSRPATVAGSFATLPSSIAGGFSGLAAEMSMSTGGSWLASHPPAPPADSSEWATSRRIKTRAPKYLRSAEPALLREQDQVNDVVRSVPALPNIVSHNAMHIGGSYLYQALELSMAGPKLLPRKALPRNFVELEPTSAY